MDHICEQTLAGEGAGQRGPEKGLDRPNALGTGRGCRTGRRIDADDRNAAYGIVLEEIAIIACELDNEAFRPKLALDKARGDVLGRVLDKDVAERGEIGIVGAKQLFRRDGMEDLDKRAARTEDDD